MTDQTGTDDTTPPTAVPHTTPIPRTEAVDLATRFTPLRRTLVHRNGRIIDVPPNYKIDHADRTRTLVATVARGETTGAHREGAFTTVLVGPEAALRADHAFESAAVACHADAVSVAAGRTPTGGHRWTHDTRRADA